MKWSELSVEQREQVISERVPRLKEHPWLYCHDIEEAGLWARSGCCDSCHEDDEVYGYDLCSVFLPDGRLLECCCSLSLWIRQATQGYVTTPQWMLDLEKSIEVS